MDGVKLTELWERRSKKGNTYFGGFLGKASIVLLKSNKEPPREGVEAIWELWVQEKRNGSD